MNVISFVLILVFGILFLWCTYQYLWKNEDLKGNRLKHNVMGILFGNRPVPKDLFEEEDMHKDVQSK